MYLDNFYQPDLEEVKNIPWNDDPKDYDRRLFALGDGWDKFVVLNPYADRTSLFYINEIPETEKCIVWNNTDGTWLAKFFHENWHPELGYQEENIPEIELIWAWNPDIDKLMKFDQDLYGKFEPLPWERDEKMVWFMDKRFNPLDDDVWVFSCAPKGISNPKIRHMGHVTPLVDIEYNPDLPKLYFNIDDCCPPFWDLHNLYVCELDGDWVDIAESIWVFKISPAYRKPRGYTKFGYITPQYKIEYNPALPKMDYEIDTVFQYHDLVYEHTYYLNQIHLPNGEDDIWTFKLRFTDNPTGEKDQGFIQPIFHVKTNPELPDFNYSFNNYDIPYFDMKYEHVFLLDPKHTKDHKSIWAFKVKAVRKPSGSKVIDKVNPQVYVEVNGDLEGYEFDLEDYIPQYYDMAYENVFYLDEELAEGKEIWAVKFSYVDNPIGWKNVGYITPKSYLRLNPNLKNLKIDIDYQIPYFDRDYLHVWYLDQLINGEKIWAAKMAACSKPEGVKDMGLVIPLIPERLDVFFISYDEINADENYARVLEKAPWAKRIHGVEGIFEAHLMAAEQSNTDMFYVVDGDAYLTDSFDFDFQPNIFDRDCTYVWTSINPINNLEYGYGAVKLISSKILIKNKSLKKLDMTTSIGKKLKVLPEISNYSMFNTDNFSVWKSAFREAVKLKKNIVNGIDVKDSTYRLNIWCSIGAKEEYGYFSVHGALDGLIYFNQHQGKDDALMKINDRRWLKEYFRTIYGDV